MLAGVDTLGVSFLFFSFFQFYVRIGIAYSALDRLGLSAYSHG